MDEQQPSASARPNGRRRRCRGLGRGSGSHVRGGQAEEPDGVTFVSDYRQPVRESNSAGLQSRRPDTSPAALENRDPARTILALDHRREPGFRARQGLHRPRKRHHDGHRARQRQPGGPSRAGGVRRTARRCGPGALRARRVRRELLVRRQEPDLRFRRGRRRPGPASVGLFRREPSTSTLPDSWATRLRSLAVAGPSVHNAPPGPARSRVPQGVRHAGSATVREHSVRSLGAPLYARSSTGSQTHARFSSSASAGGSG